MRKNPNTGRSTERRGNQLIVCAFVAVIAMAPAACNTWGPHESVTAPSDDPTLIATISAPVTPVVDRSTRLLGDLIPFSCSNDLRYTGPLDIAMTAAHDVDLHKVTFRLVHLSDLTGSVALAAQATNSFSEEELAEAFGSTHIPGGTVRSFRFHTRLPCGRQIPQSVAADIKFVEFSGRKNSITTTALFVSEIDVQFDPTLPTR